MKKLILCAVLTAALFSCKKETSQPKHSEIKITTDCVDCMIVFSVDGKKDSLQINQEANNEFIFLHTSGKFEIVTMSVFIQSGGVANIQATNDRIVFYNSFSGFKINQNELWFNQFTLR